MSKQPTQYLTDSPELMQLHDGELEVFYEGGIGWQPATDEQLIAYARSAEFTAVGKTDRAVQADGESLIADQKRRLTGFKGVAYPPSIESDIAEWHAKEAGDAILNAHRARFALTRRRQG